MGLSVVCVCDKGRFAPHNAGVLWTALLLVWWGSQAAEFQAVPMPGLSLPVDRLIFSLDFSISCSKTSLQPLNPSGQFEV